MVLGAFTTLADLRRLRCSKCPSACLRSSDTLIPLWWTRGTNETAEVHHASEWCSGSMAIVGASAATQPCLPDRCDHDLRRERSGGTGAVIRPTRATSQARMGGT